MFSSIEENLRKKVIINCYWPLLKLAKYNDVKIGIEATGNTLEIINNLDSSWIKELKKLIGQGRIYFIGSGYSQLIAPLVPGEVNKKNLILGDLIYQDILNFKPKIALLNEQAFSSSLIKIYSEQGYEALIMEWNNCFHANKYWDSDFQYYVQNATNTLKEYKTKVIWNNSISFQKFQRYVHGENNITEHINYLKSHINNQLRSFPLYGNDAEVFDFRPGRFNTESSIMDEGEWIRIDKLIKSISNNHNFKWISLHELLEYEDSLENIPLVLEDINQIIPVKKQRKYNINRWAVTGKDDFRINAKCHKIYENLKNSSLNNDLNNWKELCYLWSSDFRTHITKKRWEEYQKRLLIMDNKCSFISNLKNKENNCVKHKTTNNKDLIYKQDRKFLYAEFNDYKIIFNLNKGLAIESYTNKLISNFPIFGTLPHGYFEDITWLADWFSGHLTFYSPGQNQITDLLIVKPDINEDEKIFSISGIIETKIGKIYKTWEIDKFDNSLNLKYKLDWPSPDLGSLRIHPITFFPNLIEHKNLSIKVSNGGFSKEQFFIGENLADHGGSVSSLVSSNQGLGLTDGEIVFFDKNLELKISFDRKDSPFIGMLTNKKINDKLFTRLSLSSQEIDDTSKKKFIELKCKIKISTKKL